MKKRILPLFGSLALAVAMLVGLNACDRAGNPVSPIKTKLTADNIAKIQPGMNRTQVEALLGPPTTIGDTKQFAIFTKTTVTYIEGKDSLEVVYKNQEVEEKHSTVGGGETTTSTTTTTTKTN
jgi:outer membrane protein assembly factor BamE (lipoprotein component of BamABCDE complex)